MPRQPGFAPINSFSAVALQAGRVCISARSTAAQPGHGVAGATIHARKEGHGHTGCPGIAVHCTNWRSMHCGSEKAHRLGVVMNFLLCSRMRQLALHPFKRPNSSKLTTTFVYARVTVTEHTGHNLQQMQTASTLCIAINQNKKSSLKVPWLAKVLCLLVTLRSPRQAFHSLRTRVLRQEVRPFGAPAPPKVAHLKWVGGWQRGLCTLSRKSTLN